MNKQDLNIDEILRNAKQYDLSEAKNQEILRAVDRMEVKSVPAMGTSYISLTNFIMSNIKKIAATMAVVAIVLGVSFSGVIGGGQTAYASHLEKAAEALHALEMLQVSGEDADAERIQELVQEVVQETKMAMESVEKDAEGEQLQKALQEIQQFQERSMNAFQETSRIMNAAKVGQSEGVGEGEMGESAEKTQEQTQIKEQVKNALEEAVKQQEQVQTMLKQGVAGASKQMSQSQKGL
ncbi:hypothetical protein KKD70_03650 [Patescibacteria group bacterium]|nr:hypothetical protein [Patescibacteria group bacterium]